MNDAWTLIGVLAGVVVGFGLGEGSRWVRGKLRIDRLRRMFREELKAMKQQIPEKKEMLLDAISALRGREAVPEILAVPVIDVGYSNHFPEVYEHLSYRQRNCIHVIHHHLKIADRIMKSFKDEFMEVLERNKRGASVLFDPWKTHIRRLESILTNYDNVERWIDGYLAGNPPDVFPQVDRSPAGDDTR